MSLNDEIYLLCFFVDKREGDKNWRNIKIPGGQTFHFPTEAGEAQRAGEKWDPDVYWEVRDAARAAAEKARKQKLDAYSKSSNPSK